MDLDLRRALIGLGEHGSMTAAAAALHLSQPALHGQLARLAEQVGAPLYRRCGRGIELTPEGIQALACARSIEERWQALRNDLAGGGPPAPVVLAAGQGAFLHLIGPALRAFHARSIAPLRLLTRAGPQAIDALRRGEVHLAVAATPQVPEGTAGDVLARVGAAALVPRRHPLARKRTLRLRDLDGERLIVPPPGAPHREALARALEAEGIRWEPAVEAQGWELAARFARMGLGIAVVNAFVRAEPGVHARPLHGLAAVTYRVLRRDGEALAPGPRALRDALLTERTSRPSPVPP